MTDQVEFVEAEHRYIVNAIEFPSVSTVLHFFCDLSRVPRSTLELKRKIGRAAHKAIQFYESGELDEETVDEAVLPYLESWIRFKAVKPLRVVASEEIVYSKKHRYAGRLDLNVEFEDKPGVWQLDAKCVYTMAPETSLQTAAYAEAWNELHPEQKVTRRAGLQLQPDGSIAKLYPYTERTDFALFLNALNLYRWINNHRR